MLNIIEVFIIWSRLCVCGSFRHSVFDLFIVENSTSAHKLVVQFTPVYNKCQSVNMQVMTFEFKFLVLFFTFWHQAEKISGDVLFSTT
jgi:hypothetical protein